MKSHWLNIVLNLSNQVYKRKQLLIVQTGVQAASNVFILILLELYLAVLSVPLYITMQPAFATAYMEERGALGKTAYDYNLRRILTLSGLSIFFFIWAMKLVLILAVPYIYGPLQLYTVSEPRKADIVSSALISTQSAIQTARIDKTMPRSVLKEVRKEQNGNYLFSGVGLPNATAVVFLSDIQTAVYYDVISRDGTWTVEHSEKDFKLSAGNHSVLVFNYDRSTQTRSDISDQQYFKVRLNFWDWLIKNVDTLANWSVVVIIAMGMFLTVLTL